MIEGPIWQVKEVLLLASNACVYCCYILYLLRFNFLILYLVDLIFFVDFIVNWFNFGVCNMHLNYLCLVYRFGLMLQGVLFPILRFFCLSFFQLHLILWVVSPLFQLLLLLLCHLLLQLFLNIFSEFFLQFKFVFLDFHWLHFISFFWAQKYAAIPGMVTPNTGI